MYRPNPSDDFPNIIIGLDGFAEGRHRPDHVLGALAREPLLLKRVAWAETPCAKRDHPEQRVVVIAINPNLIGEGCRHATTTTASMAATAVVRSVYLETFGGDTGEVLIGAFQLASWRADRALKWRHGLLGRGIAATGQCGYDQTHKNSADCLRHGRFCLMCPSSEFLGQRAGSFKGGPGSSGW
jgi:hypothetical protein